MWHKQDCPRWHNSTPISAISVHPISSRCVTRAACYTSSVPGQGGSVDIPQQPQYWLYAPGEDAANFRTCLTSRIMIMEYPELGNYAQYHSINDIRQAAKVTYDNSKSYINVGLMLWNFQHVMQVGDIIFAKRGMRKVIGRGVVLSAARYEPELTERFHMVREVEWLYAGNWDSPFTLAAKTLTNITQKPDYITALTNLFPPR